MDKMHDQLRKFKEDTIKHYATYNDKCSSEHQEAERKIAHTEQENARVRQENDSLVKAHSAQGVRVTELEQKLKSYIADYERVFRENRQLREQNV